MKRVRSTAITAAMDGARETGKHGCGRHKTYRARVVLAFRQETFILLERANDMVLIWLDSCKGELRMYVGNCKVTDVPLSQSYIKGAHHGPAVPGPVT